MKIIFFMATSTGCRRHPCLRDLLLLLVVMAAAAAGDTPTTIGKEASSISPRGVAGHKKGIISNIITNGGGGDGVHHAAAEVRGTRTSGIGSHKKTPLYTLPYTHIRDRLYLPPTTQHQDQRHIMGGDAGPKMYAAIVNTNGHDDKHGTPQQQQQSLVIIDHYKAQCASQLKGSGGGSDELDITSEERNSTSCSSIVAVEVTTIGEDHNRQVQIKPRNMSWVEQHVGMNIASQLLSKEQQRQEGRNKAMEEMEILKHQHLAKYINLVGVQGIYGVYHLPASGPCLVLITENEPIYNASCSFSSHSDGSLSTSLLASSGRRATTTTTARPAAAAPARTTMKVVPFLNIQRVVRLDIIPIPPAIKTAETTTTGRWNSDVTSVNQQQQQQQHGDNSNNSVRARATNTIIQQQREEKRQIKLLRQAFHLHDFYFTHVFQQHQRNNGKEFNSSSLALSASSMTHTLQRRATLGKECASANSTNSSSLNGKKVTDKNTDNTNINCIGHDTSNENRSTTRNILKNNNNDDADSRFFWNQDLQSIFFDKATYSGLYGGARCFHTATSQTRPNDGEHLSSSVDAAMRLVQSWIVPCTSAFVGVHTGIRTTRQSDNQDSSSLSTSSTKGSDDSSASTTLSSPSSSLPHKTTRRNRMSLNYSRNDVVYDHVLISRRSRYRAGTRFTRRGTNANGNVANYVETEQIILVRHENNNANIYDSNGTDLFEEKPKEEERVRVASGAENTVKSINGKIEKEDNVEGSVSSLQDRDHSSSSPLITELYSHVQTRGSIPILWSSPADVRTYAPRVRIGLDPLAQARALRAHLVEQIKLYVKRNLPVSSSLLTQTTIGIGQGHSVIDLGLKNRNAVVEYTTTENSEHSTSAPPPQLRMLLLRRGKKATHPWTAFRPTASSARGATNGKLEKIGNPCFSKLIFLNLVDKKGDQGRLGKAFDAVLDAVLDVYNKQGLFVDPINKAAAGQKFGRLISETKRVNADSKAIKPESKQIITDSPIKHIWYDFHAECKGGKWYKLKSLLSSLQNDLNGQGYFSAAPASSGSKDMFWDILSLQNGVVRTNCMDCLDRTNVVQSIIARYILFHQLRERICTKVGTSSSLFKSQEISCVAPSTGRNLPLEYTVEFQKNLLTIPWDSGEYAHRHLWSDNADAISRLYAGTRALKGDFTRTGQRTKRGALDDGVSSLTRYYLNNFADAARQEGVDLLTGAVPFSRIDDEEDKEEQERTPSGFSSNVDLVPNNEGSSFIDGLDGFSSMQNMHRERLAVKGGDKAFFDSVYSSVREKHASFRWLPGDLKSYVKNAVEGNCGSSPNGGTAALVSIDRRANSHLPWWVDGDVDNICSIKLNQDATAADMLTPLDNRKGTSDEALPVYVEPSSGYVFSLLLISSRVPLVMAAAVISLLLPGISANMKDHG